MIYNQDEILAPYPQPLQIPYPLSVLLKVVTLNMHLLLSFWDRLGIISFQNKSLSTAYLMWHEGIYPIIRVVIFLKSAIILGVFSAIFFCSCVFYQAGDFFPEMVGFIPWYSA